jgi:hypothetical protein
VPDLEKAPVTPADGTAPAVEAADVVVSDVKGSDKVTVGGPVADKPASDAPLVADDTPKMPDGGHEKYWNAEKSEYNWEAHARELAWKDDQKAAAVEGDQLANATAEGDKAATDAAEHAGVDIDAFNEYVAEHGAPSEEHLAMFEKAGIPPETVKDYVALKVEQAERHLGAITEFFGGESAIANLNQHLAKNYTPKEIEAFNEQLMNPGTWRVTASYLLQEAGMPRGGKGLIKGPNAQTPSNDNGESFASETEFNTAMRDPRYKTDPSYRVRVMNALRNSPHLTK